MAIQTSDNPQGDMDPIELTAMSEPEITYELSVFKQKMPKNKDKSVMAELHARATYTCKVMTK